MNEALNDLLTRGGGPLAAIALVSTLLWLLALERYWYYARGWRTRLAKERQTAPAQAVLLLIMKESLYRNFELIRACRLMLPLLGLLGTVNGMILVFDIMTSFGTGNPRGMADGISHALLPVMAGLITTLCGLALEADLRHRAAACLRRSRALA